MPPRRRIQAEIDAEATPTQQLVDLLLASVQGRQQNPPPVEPNVPRVTLFKDFKLAGPPEFRGTDEPIKAQNWITEIEKVFKVTKISDDQKTDFATYFLKEEANHWWEVNQTRAGEGIITWDRFKEIFFENYFPESMKDRMEIRFLELKQGELTVSQYAAKFNELARFASHQVETEARKARRFEDGLKPQIRSKLYVLQIKTFKEILEKAIIDESESEALIKFHKEKKTNLEVKGNTGGSNNNNKRKWNATSSNNSGEGERNFNHTENFNNNNREGVNLCKVCGKGHQGECRYTKVTCYSCGQGGHFANRCPQTNNKGCYNCGSVDHIVINCPKPKKRNGGGNQNNSGQ